MTAMAAITAMRDAAPMAAAPDVELMAAARVMHFQLPEVDPPPRAADMAEVLPAAAEQAVIAAADAVAASAAAVARAVVLAAAAMPAADLAAAATWVAAAAMAAAVTGKFIFGSSPKSPSASPATCGGADGACALFGLPAS
jgi:hypothetical protein